MSQQRSSSVICLSVNMLRALLRGVSPSAGDELFPAVLTGLVHNTSLKETKTSDEKTENLSAMMEAKFDEEDDDREEGEDSEMGMEPPRHKKPRTGSLSSSHQTLPEPMDLSDGTVELTENAHDCKDLGIVTADQLSDAVENQCNSFIYSLPSEVRA